MTAQPTDGPPLTEVVRARIVALTAEVLPQVSPLPAQLKRVADFTASRRARLGARQIALTVGLDDEFRGHVAVQVGVLLPELATAVHEGEIPDTADPVDVAALLWLLRPEGWREAFATANGRVAERQASIGSGRDAEELERLRSRLADSEQEAREQKARSRARIDALKSENSVLRRKLGDAREGERAARQVSQEAVEAARTAGEVAQNAAAAGDSELRRLRARIVELEAVAGAARRESRAERDEGTLRARLLLDTVLESAQGLRRELSLPAVSGSPGDRVETALVSTESGVRSTSAAGTLGPSSPMLLENYLALPRARLIIDGYNVSKSAWADSSLEAQRIRLLAGIAPLVARTGAETTVVFDAASSESRPPVNPPRGVKVIFSPMGMIADDVIRDLVGAEPEGRVVVVVSTDQEVVADVRRSGARTVESAALIGLLTR